MEFLIKKGKYYCSNWYFGLHAGATYQKEIVRFDKSCLYTPDRENDWNKGTGFTYSLFNDNNSIRWAWRPSKDFPNLIEVGIYVHKNGEIIQPFNTEFLNINEDYTFILVNNRLQKWIELKIDDRHYKAKDYKYCLFEDINIKPTIGYINRPYFGGNNPAPHDIKINITKIK